MKRKIFGEYELREERRHGGWVLYKNCRFMKMENENKNKNSKL